MCWNVIRDQRVKNCSWKTLKRQRRIKLQACFHIVVSYKCVEAEYQIIIKKKECGDSFKRNQMNTIRFLQMHLTADPEQTDSAETRCCLYDPVYTRWFPAY